MSTSFEEILPQLIEREYNVITVFHDATLSDKNINRDPARFEKTYYYLYKESDEKLYFINHPEALDQPPCSFAQLENRIMKENNNVLVWHQEIPIGENASTVEAKLWEVQDGRIRFVPKEESRDCFRTAEC